MTFSNDHFHHLKLIAANLIKKIDQVKMVVSHFNEKESIVLSIRTIADINKISAAAESLKMEVKSFVHSKLREFKKEPEHVDESLIVIRHEMRMLIGIVKGYSEMVIEDLEEDQLKILVEKLIPVLNICNQIILLIDELRENVDISMSNFENIKVQKRFVDEKPSALSLYKTHYGKTDQNQNAILIVDDSDSNCELLNNWLQRKNYNTYIAKSGKQALAMLEKHPEIDLVLLDVMMPFMNGYEVLLRIKSNEKYADTMVIMVSGMDEIDTVVRCIMSGAEDYLVKPFNPYLLAARIYACFEKKRLNRIEEAYRGCLLFLYLFNINHPLFFK